MTAEPVPPRRRRRRRAVWRAGAGISRTDEAQPGPGEDAAAVTAEVDDTAADTGADTGADTAADTGPARPEAPRPGPPADAPADPKPPSKRRRSEPSERGLRDLVGAGPSQVGPVRAMRARDANRPTPEDLAQAEQDVVIVRRHWKPPKS